MLADSMCCYFSKWRVLVSCSEAAGKTMGSEQQLLSSQHFQSVVFVSLFAVTTSLCLQMKSRDGGWHLSVRCSDLFDHSPNMMFWFS